MLIHITGGGVFLGSVYLYKERPVEIWTTSAWFAPIVEKATGATLPIDYRSCRGSYTKREIRSALQRLENGDPVTIGLAGVDHPAPRVFYTADELVGLIRERMGA